jgi:hypothetical protein
MKNLILTSLLILQCTTAFGKRLTFADMQGLLPNLEQSGTEISPHYTCTIKTQWLENGDLEVTGTQTYKDMDPSTMKIVFAAAKEVEVDQDKYDGAVEYTISQSTLLYENVEDDERVDLFESFNFEVKDSTVTRVQVQYAEVNHHSDPHEDSINCSFEK